MAVKIDDESIGGFLVILFATISLLSSCLILLILHRFQQWNGFYSLIRSLVIAQAIYDLAYYFIPAYRIPELLSVYQFLIVYSGLAVCWWTNVLSAIQLYYMAYLQSFNLKRVHKISNILIVSSSVAIAAALVIVSYLQPSDQSLQYVFLWFRIFSLIINIVIFLIVTFIFNQPKCAKNIDFCCQHDFSLRNATQDLLTVLTSRIKYYPIVQILARIASFYWDYKYGFNISSFDAGNYSLRKGVVYYFYCVCSPSAGLGFFIIFLYIQPAARKELQNIISSCCCRIQSSNKDLDRRFDIENPISSSLTAGANNNNNNRDSINSNQAERNSIVISAPDSTKKADSLPFFKTETNAKVSNDHDDNQQPSLKQELIRGSMTSFSLAPHYSSDKLVILNQEVYDMDEELLWEEVYRRKLSRESMLVHN